MRQSLVFTVIGPDRPGLIDAVAQAVNSHAGNWRESRFAKLAGQFAGIVHVDAEPDDARAITTAIEQLAERGLKVTVGSSEAEPATDAGQSLHLELLGLDRTGIVRDVSQALAKRDINIVEWESDVISAPMSGEQMFKAVALLAAPDAVDLEALQDELDTIAAELDLDLNLRHPD
jgi:glycine cleavage system regulatory protein